MKAGNGGLFGDDTGRLTLPDAGEVGEPSGPSVIDLHRENVRARLAYSVMAILGLEVVTALIALFFVVPDPTYKDWFVTIFSSTTTLVASVTGFYFGTQSEK